MKHDDIPTDESTDDSSGFDMNDGGTDADATSSTDPDESMEEMELGGDVTMDEGADSAGEKAFYIVEYRKPTTEPFGFSDAQSALEGVPGLELDPDFPPTVVPPTPDVTMNPETEEIVAVRARASEEDIERALKTGDIQRATRDESLVPLDMELEAPDTAGALESAPSGEVDPNFDFATPTTAMSETTYCPTSQETGRRPPSATAAEVAERIGATRLHERGITGQGVTVAILDGGITAEGRTIQQQDTADPRFNGKRIPNVVDGSPEDWGTTGSAWKWHGSMCATDVLSVAPDVELYDLRLSSGSIDGLFSTILKRLDWAIERHRTTGKPDIISASIGIYREDWSEQYANDPLHIVTRKFGQAIDEGIVVLMAAGNCGEECPSGRCEDDVGPGRSIWGANGHPKMISVGGSTVENKRIGYSSQGPARIVQQLGREDTKPDICAFTDFTGYWDGSTLADGGSDRDSGTSAATPVAAGVVALLKQADPDLRQDDVKRLLQETAVDIGSEGDDENTGFGVIRADAAYERLTGTEIGPTTPAEVSWTDLGGNLLTAPSVASADGRRLDVVGVGPGYRPFLKTHDGTWGEWRPLGSRRFLTSPAVVSREAGTLDVFYADAEGMLHRQRYTDGSAVGQPHSLGGPILHAPAAVVRDGGIDVLAVSAGGNPHLYHRRVTDGSLGTWRRVGGVCTSAPAVVSRTPGTLDVFVRGDSGAYHASLDGDHWSDWEALGGPVLHGVAAAARGGARMDLFAISHGGKCYTKAFEDGAWQDWSKVDDTVGITAPAAVSHGEGGVDLFLVGSDASLRRCVVPRGH